MFFDSFKSFVILLLVIFLCFSGFVFALGYAESVDGSNLVISDYVYEDGEFIWPVPRLYYYYFSLWL